MKNKTFDKQLHEFQATPSSNFEVSFSWILILFRMFDV